jgi:hypothetical protein
MNNLKCYSYVVNDMLSCSAMVTRTSTADNVEDTESWSSFHVETL